jgi:hypothetical protein
LCYYFKITSLIEDIHRTHDRSLSTTSAVSLFFQLLTKRCPLLIIYLLIPIRWASMHAQYWSGRIDSFWKSNIFITSAQSEQLILSSSSLYNEVESRLILSERQKLQISSTPFFFPFWSTNWTEKLHFTEKQKNKKLGKIS